MDATAARGAGRPDGRTDSSPEGEKGQEIGKVLLDMESELATMRVRVVDAHQTQSLSRHS